MGLRWAEVQLADILFQIDLCVRSACMSSVAQACVRGILSLIGLRSPGTAHAKQHDKDDKRFQDRPMLLHQESAQHQPGGGGKFTHTGVPGSAGQASTSSPSCGRNTHQPRCQLHALRHKTTTKTSHVSGRILNCYHLTCIPDVRFAKAPSCMFRWDSIRHC